MGLATWGFQKAFPRAADRHRRGGTIALAGASEGSDRMTRGRSSPRRAPPCEARPKLAGITGDAGYRARPLEFARAPEVQPDLRSRRALAREALDRAHFQTRRSKHAGRNADDFDAGRCGANVVRCLITNRDDLVRDEPHLRRHRSPLRCAQRWEAGADALGAIGSAKEERKKAKKIVILGIDPRPTRCSGDRPAQPRTGGSIDQGASPRKRRPVFFCRWPPLRPPALQDRAVRPDQRPFQRPLSEAPVRGWRSSDGCVAPRAA
jgi:hypothetical protein